MQTVIDNTALLAWRFPGCTAVLDEYGFPQAADVLGGRHGLKAEDLRGYMANDKKRSGDYITLVVPKRIGECELREVPVKDLDSWLAPYVDG